MINVNSSAIRKHCASFKSPPNGVTFTFTVPNAQKERRPALQGRNMVKGIPPFLRQRRKRQIWSMLVPSPSLVGWVCGSYSFPSIKLLRKNKVVPGHKFGDPLQLRLDRESIKHKIMSSQRYNTNFLWNGACHIKVGTH